jgi:uncharacterized protein (TIGR02466 family)
VNGFIKIMNGTLKSLIMPNIEIVNPFNPFIFKLHFNFDWDILKPICENLIVGNTDRATSQANYKKPHLMQEFNSYYQWLNIWVNHTANDMMAFSEYKMQHYITDSYVNVHKKGAKASEHNHACNAIVVAAYLKIPENGGFFEAKDPLEYHKTTLPISPERLWSQIPTDTGDVLIFPSWLQHRTQPNLSEENRWVLTTNYSYKF